MVLFKSLILVLCLSFSTVVAKNRDKKSCTASCEEDVKHRKICKTVKECTTKRCSASAGKRSKNSFCCADSDCAAHGHKCQAKKCVADNSLDHRAPKHRPTMPKPRPHHPMPKPHPTPAPTLVRGIPNAFTSSVPATLLAQAILDAFKASVPVTFLDRFPDQLFQQIIHDSPTGFVPGALKLGSLSKDLPDYQVDPNVPIMDFEMPRAGNSLELDGYFIPSAPVVTIPSGTVVRIYAQDGLHATSTVNVASGYFRVTITDMPPGGIPILFTFASPSYDGINNGPFILKLATSPPPGTFASPNFAYVKNSNSCAPAVSFTLAWNGPSSNLDLHVFEPSGTEVYNSNKIGTSGSLDVTDASGYGPENYFAPHATSGQRFRAQVHGSSMNKDATVVWTLQARTNGELLWTKTGIFTRANQDSAIFEVEIGKTGRLSPLCKNTCPPTFENSWWWSVWNWYGDEENDNQAQIDLYNAISGKQNPTKEELKLIVHLLFLPAVAKTSDKNYRGAHVTQYEAGIDAITRSCDIPCTTGFILEAVCDFANKESSSRALEFLLDGGVKTLQTVAPYFGGSAFIDWEKGYLRYMESLRKFKVDKMAILEEVNAAATLGVIDGLASHLKTCIPCNRGLRLRV